MGLSEEREGFEQSTENIDIASQQVDEGLVHEPNPDEQDPRITPPDEDGPDDLDDDKYDEGDDEFEEGLLGEDDED